MKATTALKGTAVVTGAVVAGVLSVGGTWALWNAAMPAGAGAVSSADFRMELTGADSSPMTLPDGTSATVTMTSPADPLIPGGHAVFAVDITNATEASASFPVRVSLGEPTMAEGPAGLEAALSFDTAAEQHGSCATADSSAPAAITVAPGDSAQLCLTAALATDASPELSSSTAAVSVPVSAEQLPAR